MKNFLSNWQTAPLTIQFIFLSKSQRQKNSKKNSYNLEFVEMVLKKLKIILVSVGMQWLWRSEI